jgi:hypothetical protein
MARAVEMVSEVAEAMEAVVRAEVTVVAEAMEAVVVLVRVALAGWEVVTAGSAASRQDRLERVT